MKLPTEILQEAKALVASRLGLDFSDDREPELSRAITEAQRTAKLPSLEACLARLAQEAENGPEWRRLASLLTIGETSFFRDTACFEALEATVLPGLIAARRAIRAQSLRLWSAGCATGEEPYSLAILLDQLLPDRQRWDVTILATDIDATAIEKARRAVYGPWSLRGLPAEVRGRYFARRPGKSYELNAEVRGAVSFATENLTRGASVGPVDLILCRNVLMYLTPDAAQAAVTRLQAALVEDGWLIVAAAEASAERFQPLAPVNFPGAIFFKRSSAQSAHDARTATPSRSFPVAARVARMSPKVPTPPVDQPPVDAQPPPSALELLARARTAADRGCLDEALGLCRAALENEPLLAEAHQLLGAIHQERGEIDAAAAALRRAVYLDPDSAEAHRALGHLLLKQGERRRGQKQIEAAAYLDRRAEAS